MSSGWTPGKIFITGWRGSNTKRELEPGTDFWAVENGYISITPIHHDLTHYACLEMLTGRDWLEEV